MKAANYPKSLVLQLTRGHCRTGADERPAAPPQIDSKSSRSLVVRYPWHGVPAPIGGGDGLIPLDWLVGFAHVHRGSPPHPNLRSDPGTHPRFLLVDESATPRCLSRVTLFLGSSEYARRLRAARVTIITGALVGAEGNRTRAARQLGLTRSYLCRLIRDLGIVVRQREAGFWGRRCPSGTRAAPRGR